MLFTVIRMYKGLEGHEVGTVGKSSLAYQPFKHEIEFVSG